MNITNPPASFPRRIQWLPMLAALFCCVSLASAAVIDNVVETGGDNEATDTIPAKWTGITWNTTIANEPIPSAVGTPYTVLPFGNGVPCFVDRNHIWVGASTTIPIPSYLVGAEYIMDGNDNRDNTGLTLDVTVNAPVQVYMLIDNRMGPATEPTANANNPPTFGTSAMQWILDEAWVPVQTGANRNSDPAFPDEVGYDESADGTINQWASIYTKSYPAGTFRLKQADNAGRNMYGVVVAPLAVVDPPPTPTGLTEFSQDSRVTLRWNASVGATEYLVKRAEVSGGPYTTIATGNFLTYADTTVANGTVYYYVVSGRNTAGESPNSSEVTARPNIAPVLTATGGTNQVSLTWNVLAGATSYTVARGTNSGGPYTTLATGLTSLNYLDTPLPGGQRFYYLVSGVLGGGVPSGFSAEAAALTAPSPLTNSYAELFALTVAKVWFRTPDVVVPTVSIEKSSDGIAYSLFTNINAVTAYALDPGLTPSSTVYFRLRAANATGFSPYQVHTLTTPASGYNVNFANVSNATSTVTAPTPPGHLQDVGLIFGDRGNGYNYGWDRDITADGRYRRNAASPDLRYDTFNHLQKASPSAIWEMEIPGGLYLVRLAGGESDNNDSTLQFSLEGLLTKSVVVSAASRWAEFTNTLYVSDGRLTITSGPNAANNKLDFVHVYPAAPAPNILVSNPVSLNLVANRTAKFTVVVGGGPEPYGIQWYFNNNPIPGANQPTYTIPFVTAGDEGDYYAVVTNASVVVDPGTAVTSTTARLTVTPDTVGPKVLSVGSLDGYSIGVCYSEMINTNGAPPPALDVFSYAVSDANGARTVNAVVLRPDLAAVQLIIDGVNGPLAGAFTVTASGITDIAGNSTAESSGTNTAMGFTAQDVGTPAFGGTNFVCDSDRIELVGNGADIWGAADQFHLASKSTSGDFDARVRVIDLVGSNAITKAALMVRESADAGSRTLHLSVNPVPPGRDQFQPGVRDVTAGGYGYWGTNYVPSAIPNAWLRITRIGDTFRGYRSTNGTDWILMAQTNQTYPAAVLVGLGVTAHDNTLRATGVFSSFSLSAVTGTDVGIAQIAPTVVALGSDITFTMNVTNLGPADATGVVVTDPLPAGVTFVSAVASQGSCSQVAGVVTCNLGNLANAASAQITIVGTASSSGSKVNTATVSLTGVDLNPANNTAAATVTVPVPPSITTPVVSGGTVAFSIATQPGVTYKVYYKNSLADADWTLLTTIVGDGTVKPVSDPGPLPPTRFYTVRP